MKSVSLSGGIQLISNEVKVKIKKLTPEAVVPKYAKPGDAGYDLTATSVNEADMYIEYGTGLSVEIPEGYVGYLFPRSSLSNYDLALSNSVGVLDSGFRGEVMFRFKALRTWDEFPDGSVTGPRYYEVGDRIGQLIVMPVPKMVFEEAEELSETERGSGGYGSSGK